VLLEGTSIEVTAGGQKLAIVAGKGFERSYQWGDCALEAHMTPRKKRFEGRFGIGDAAARSGVVDLFKFSSCGGVSRTVVEENQLHFLNIESAEEWIRHRSKRRMSAWSNDGIVVSWVVSPFYIGPFAMGGVSANLSMLCINGQRPNRLAGASDSAIKLIPPKGKGSALHDCAIVSEETVLDTQRALQKEWARAKSNSQPQQVRGGDQK
jgi:hypothetical protein